jgi:hypothetical protein
MKRHTLLIAMITVCSLVLRCTEMSATGNGGSSETVNAKVIVIDTMVSATIDDNGAMEFSMQTFAQNYRPCEKTGFSVTVVAQSGAAAMAAVPSQGIYNILLTCSARGSSCFVGDILLVKGSTDTIDCRLTETRTISGELVTADTSHIDDSYIVSIYGSPFYAVTDPKNGFSLIALPPGGYTLSVRSTAKRLFIGTSNYVFTTDDNTSPARLRVVIP